VSRRDAGCFRLELIGALRQDQLVRWDEDTRAGVDVALNEADVLGIRLEPSGAWCELLVHVLALQESGPIDPAARRILRLASPARVRVLLRPLQPRPDKRGLVIPLEGLDAVEDFFASLSWSDSMYGWAFLDVPSLTSSWPDRPSLTIDLRPAPGSHTLFWFSECGREEHGGPAAYCIEGTVAFEDLQVLRADETPQPLDQFIADADRYWKALHGRDERLSVTAQRAAQSETPSWRSFTRNAVAISGSSGPGTSSPAAPS
jgi:hypothetical protein